MKKRAFSLFLVVVMLCCIMPSTAFAASEGSASTTVSYTVGASYVINIPASINLNEGQDMRITASVMNTSYGQKVSVCIDGARTYENGGNFYLYKDKGTANEAKILCTLSVGGMINGLDYEVARFWNGDTTNEVGDPLTFQPEASHASPGTYTGTMYFKITMT